MSDKLDNRPFKYQIDQNVAIRQPDTLPLIAIRQIYNIMSKNNTGTLEDRYTIAFRTTVSDLVTRNLVRVIDGELVLIDEGMRKELEAKTKQDSVERVVKFGQWMNVIAQEQDRLAGK